MQELTKHDVETLDLCDRFVSAGHEPRVHGPSTRGGSGCDRRGRLDEDGHAEAAESRQFNQGMPEIGWLQLTYVRSYHMNRHPSVLTNRKM